MNEAILSTGAVNTPHILLLSGVGTHSILESAGIKVKVDVSGIGQNLGDTALCLL